MNIVPTKSKNILTFLDIAWLKNNAFRLVVLGLVLNFIGALVLLLGVFPSDETIEAMTQTRFGGNADLAENFRDNRTYAKLGLGLTSLGFLLELFGTLGSRREIGNLDRDASI